jgi:heat shock protein HslJ
MLDLFEVEQDQEERIAVSEEAESAADVTLPGRLARSGRFPGGTPGREERNDDEDEEMKGQDRGPLGNAMPEERHQKRDPAGVGEHQDVDGAESRSKRASNHKKTLTLAALVLAAACGPTNPTAEPPPGPWALQSFELAGGPTIAVPRPDQYTLELRPEGQAHVRADCNSCGGSYQIAGTSLSFGLMACTLVACPPGSLDRDYLEALGSASSFEVRNGELRILYAGGVLRFRPT